MDPNCQTSFTTILRNPLSTECFCFKELSSRRLSEAKRTALGFCLTATSTTFEHFLNIFGTVLHHVTSCYIMLHHVTYRCSHRWVQQWINDRNFEVWRCLKHVLPFPWKVSEMPLLPFKLKIHEWPSPLGHNASWRSKESKPVPCTSHIFPPCDSPETCLVQIVETRHSAAMPWCLTGLTGHSATQHDLTNLTNLTWIVGNWWHLRQRCAKDVPRHALRQGTTSTTLGSALRLGATFLTSVRLCVSGFGSCKLLELLQARMHARFL